MGRFVVIREHEQGPERLVEESAVPTEAALHKVLMRHPALIPAADLGFGRVATIGFEASVASGSADLLLLDEAGRLAIVEVKKEGNPDTRRVIAQMLDYAAALWGLTVDQFEQDVLRGRFGTTNAGSIREFILTELVADADDLDDAADRTLEGLAEALQAGDFSLVLAAPTVPAPVRRVIEYLNACGHSVYGLEVSYFHGDVEAFVPRLVARPLVSGRTAGQSARRAVPTVDADTIVAGFPEECREPAQKFLEAVEDLGAELDWKPGRVRIRVRGESGPKVVAKLTPSDIGTVHGPLKGLDPAAGERAAERFSAIPSAKAGTTYGSLSLSAGTNEIIEGLKVVREYVKDLVNSVAGGTPVSSGRSEAAVGVNEPRTAQERPAAARTDWQTRRG